MGRSHLIRPAIVGLCILICIACAETPPSSQRSERSSEPTMVISSVWSSPTPTRQPQRSNPCPQGCAVATPPAGCLIKGNISASGEKIYHVPGQKYYAQTIISPDKGERWFCTEADAIAQGWRKSLQ